jgi:predicted nuclease with TOPRIM domain
MEINELPRAIDEYVELRAARIDQQHKVEEMQKEETQLKERIESTLKANGLTTGGGVHYRATIVEEQKPTVESWPLLYDYIKRTNSFDLLQRRLTENAVKLRWEDQTTIPGVTKFPVTKLSITKV